MNSPNQGAKPERYVRFQFWLSDHGQRVLYNEYSDGEIGEADVMLADRVVDLQHWDGQSGTILNHLIDAGWQPGTVPYGVDCDAPIPEILPDHETLQEPARAPAQEATRPPVPTQAAKPSQARACAHQAPPERAPDHRHQPPQGKTASPIPAPRSACVLPVPKPVPPTARSKRDRGLFATICSWIWVLVIISAISRCSGHADRMTNSGAAQTPAPALISQDRDVPRAASSCQP